jgi:uncharacterized protein DUF6526
MAEKIPQTYANHVRTHPPFHFFVMPANALLLILAIVNVVRHYDALSAWILLLMSVSLTMVGLLARLNALKAQDRVIRLEERLRLSGLLSEPLRSRIGELTESQLIALRFASDAACSGLVEKALSGKMDGKQIKQVIVNWRADTFRV